MRAQNWTRIPALVLSATPGVTAAATTETIPRTIRATAEALVVVSGEREILSVPSGVLVIGWARLEAGVGTSSITVRVRRGRGIRGKELGASVSRSPRATASSSGVVAVLARDDANRAATLEYSVTVAQAGATGDGTILQSGVFVLVT